MALIHDIMDKIKSWMPDESDGGEDDEQRDDIQQSEAGRFEP